MQGSRAPPLPRSHALTCRINTITGQGLAKALAPGAADAGHRVEPVDAGSACMGMESLLNSQMFSRVPQ